MATEHTINGAHVKTRHPFAPLGLSIITFGIYGLYWYYTINREMRDMGEDVNPGKSLLAITLGAMVVIPALISMYNTAVRIGSLQAKASVPSPINPVLALCMMFIPIANILQWAYLQKNLNTVYEAKVVPVTLPPVGQVSAPPPAVAGQA